MRLGLRPLMGGVLLMALGGCSSTPPNALGTQRATLPTPSASPATPVSPSAGQTDVVQQSSSSDNTTTLDLTSDGITPVSVHGVVGGAACGTAEAVKVSLTLSLSRDGRSLPGGTALDLTQCGPFSHDLHPPAGRVHISVAALTSGNVALDLTVSSGGLSNHSIISNQSTSHSSQTGNGTTNSSSIDSHSSQYSHTESRP